jgi:hypothetical protein
MYREKQFQLADFSVPSKNYRSTATWDEVQVEIKLVSQMQDVYLLEGSLSKVGGGRLGSRQAQRAKELRADLELRVHDTIMAAGWTFSDTLGFPSYRRTQKRNALVQDIVTLPPLVQPAHQQQIVTSIVQDVVTHRVAIDLAEEKSKESDQDVTVGTYTRTIHLRPVTFTCAQCGETVTQMRYPAPTPIYCNDDCKGEAQNEKAKVRVQRMRARRKQRKAETNEQ